MQLMFWLPPFASRNVAFFLCGLLILAGRASAQFTPDALENAPTLDAAVNVLNARTAQPSTYLLLDAPDVAVPGKVRVRVRSELRGTSTLVLVRGRFQAGPATASNLAPPPIVRKIIGERPAEQPPAVWLGSHPVKAGESAQFELSFDIKQSESVTLFALAQGRWWFVTRQIKVGAPSPNRH
jgi:hypothetical protein